MVGGLQAATLSRPAWFFLVITTRPSGCGGIGCFAYPASTYRLVGPIVNTMEGAHLQLRHTNTPTFVITRRASARRGTCFSAVGRPFAYRKKLYGIVALAVFFGGVSGVSAGGGSVMVIAAFFFVSGGNRNSTPRSSLAFVVAGISRSASAIFFRP